jgi:kynureninase
MDHYEPGEEFVRSLDAADPLGAFRDRFELPAGENGRVYLLGNSLGRGVESYFEPPRSWLEVDDRHRQAMAGVVGARPGEVALTGSLTANLHLLLASFFRPRGVGFALELTGG